MFNHKKTDIVVLGAGPVGLTAAHALADRSIDYVLLDREQRTNTQSYALALHPETLELLDSINVTERVLENALRIHKVAIYENDKEKAMLDYSMLPVKYPCLAVIGQGELESILVDTLAAKAHKPLWHHRVRFIEEEKDALKVSVDRLMEGTTGYAMAHLEMQIDKILDYKANFVIGADGHDSVARRIAQIDFPEVAPSVDYAVFEFKTNADLPQEMRLIIKEGKTHVFWPLPNGYCRWSFEVSEDDAPLHSRDKDHNIIQFGDRGYPLLDQDHLEVFLAEHAPWFKGSIENLNWRMLVKFENHLANAFGKDRIWLAGDSAHMTPPAGILSMNVGMREALELVDIMTSDVTDPQRRDALAAYNATRLAEWEYLFDLNHHICAADKSAQWVLHHRNSLVGNIPASGETLTMLLAQLHLIDAA